MKDTTMKYITFVAIIGLYGAFMTWSPIPNNLKSPLMYLGGLIMFFIFLQWMLKDFGKDE